MVDSDSLFRQYDHLLGQKRPCSVQIFEFAAEFTLSYYEECEETIPIKNTSLHMKFVNNRLS